MRTETRWGLGDAVLGLLVGFGAQTVVITAYLALRDIPADTDLTELSLSTQLLLSTPLWLGLLGVPLFATWRKGRGPVDDLRLGSTWADAVRGLLIGIGTQAVLVPLLYAPILRLVDSGPDDVSSAARELTDRAGGLGSVLLVIVVCIGAPIAEEVFYRGLLLRATEKRFGTGWAVAVSTIVFGVSHLQGLQLPALLLFGFIASMLVVRSGRLGPAIWAHVGFNAWTVFVLLVIDAS